MSQRRDGLTVRIQIKDERGNVVDTVEAVAFKGLLSLAHDEGLQSVTTRVLQLPTEENGKAAVVSAKVVTRKGTFTATGDANPTNVARRIAPHVLRMAETRAIARAFRLAVNIGEVAVEELGGDVAVERAPERREQRRPEPERREQPAQAGAPANGSADTPREPPRFRGRDANPTQADAGDRRAMSEDQRKLLFRLAYNLGESGDGAAARVLKVLGVERFEYATRVDASRAIDALKTEVAGRGSNGHVNGHSSNGHSHGYANGEAGHA